MNFVNILRLYFSIYYKKTTKTEKMKRKSVFIDSFAT